MEALTNFADEAVMLPLAALIAVMLAVCGWVRGLTAWLVAITGVLGLMAVLKYVFFACAETLGNTGIHSPSGHTAASAAIYGGALVLVLRGRLSTLALAAIPPLFALLFGFSRIAVGAHDLAEVVTGGVVGVTGAALLVVMAGPRPPLRLWPAAAASLVVILVFHGLQLHAEEMIHNFAIFTWLPLPAACRVG